MDNSRMNASNNRKNDNSKLHIMGGRTRQDIPAFRTGMKMHQPFIVVAGASPRTDMAQVCVMTQWPYIVCKLHRFATASTQKMKRESSREKREEWLRERSLAWRNLSRADDLSRVEHKRISVREYMESIGETYDEEFDEPRLVAKCPGLNIYLELYGCMEDVEISKEPIGPVRDGNRIDLQGLYYYMQWMAQYIVGFTPIRERSEFATDADDWQPLRDWHGTYDSENVSMFLPRACGIGVDHIDPSRRAPRDVMHPFDEEEKEEYARLKEQQANSANPVPLNELRRQAAANVAARKMLRRMDEESDNGQR